MEFVLKTAANQIEEKISKSSRGKLFFADDFVKFGTPDNIRQLLSRLEKDDVKNCTGNLFKA